MYLITSRYIFSFVRGFLSSPRRFGNIIFCDGEQYHYPRHRQWTCYRNSRSLSTNMWVITSLISTRPSVGRQGTFCQAAQFILQPPLVSFFREIYSHNPVNKFCSCADFMLKTIYTPEKTNLLQTLQNVRSIVSQTSTRDATSRTIPSRGQTTNSTFSWWS